jgi:hypothetical protein
MNEIVLVIVDEEPEREGALRMRWRGGSQTSSTIALDMLEGRGRAGRQIRGPVIGYGCV